MILSLLFIFIIAPVGFSYIIYISFYKKNNDEMPPIVPIGGFFMGILFIVILNIWVLPLFLGNQKYDIDTQTYKLKPLDTLNNKKYYVAKDTSANLFHCIILQSSSIKTIDMSREWEKCGCQDRGQLFFNYLKLNDKYDRPTLEIKRYDPLGWNSWIYINVEEHTKYKFFIPAKSTFEINKKIN